MEWYWYILLLFLSLYFLWSYINGNKDYWAKRGVKFVNSNIIVNVLTKHFLDVQRTIYAESKKDGFCGSFELRNPVINISDLNILRNIFVKDFDHFLNRRPVEGIVGKGDNISQMLIFQEGPFWKNLRSTLSPIFTTGKIRRLFDTFHSCGEEFVREIKKKNSTEIDVEEMFGKYTMSVIASAVFGIDAKAYEDLEPGKENECIRVTSKFTNLTPLFLIKFFIFNIFPGISDKLGLTLFDPSMGIFFGNVIQRAIKDREAHPERKMNDFLELMLETRSGKLKEEVEELSKFEKEAQLGIKSKITMNDSLIEGNCILFLVAGFDTTKTGLTWAAFELALNQEIQEKLYNKLKKKKESDEGLNYESINNLEYLNMFFNEVLRKYPPAPRLDRRCEKDYEIVSKNGMKFTIPKGMNVEISAYCIHHDEEIWPEPEKFDPERFSSELKNERHPYAYLPFGHGPRNCIGMRFALTEVKVALAHLVLNFHIAPTEKTDLNPKIKSNATLKPEGKIWLKFSTRD